MGKFVTLLILTVGLAIGYVIYMCPCTDLEVPKVPDHRWWGPGKEPAGAASAKIVSRPYAVNVQDSILQDLKVRLQNTRLSPPLEGVAFQYGFNTDYLKTVLDYWRDKYDWKKEEAKLNQFPQFLAKIEGLDIHYIRATPQDKKVKVLPLLMVHGWPGSVAEFHKIIPLLTSGVDGVAFEVICPSIPGYGFSEAPHHPGFSAVDAARIFAKLMESLGHKKFYSQGGDWGALIVSTLSILYPEKVHGVHMNMPSAKTTFVSLLKYVAGYVAPSWLIENNRKYNAYPPGDFFSFMLMESGYMHIQATKPDTVGVALGDSPAGLAAYVLEKFSTWTDRNNREQKDGGLLKKYTYDELLTNVMVYWVTNSVTTSLRFYKENFSQDRMKLNFEKMTIMVPSGFCISPNELITLPPFVVKNKYRELLTFTHLERGGHFIAMEEPQLLADDIRKFVQAAEKHWDDKKKAEEEKSKKKDL